MKKNKYFNENYELTEEGKKMDEPFEQIFRKM